LETLKKIGYRPSLFLFTITKGNINIASTETPSRADVDAHEPLVDSSAISPCPSDCVSSSPVALPTRLNLLRLLDDLLVVVFLSSSLEDELLNPKKLPKVLRAGALLVTAFFCSGCFDAADVTGCFEDLDVTTGALPYLLVACGVGVIAGPDLEPGENMIGALVVVVPLLR
jgi:hypothetical protein